ncbi:MAG: hypothetical protein LH473_02170 [Chitinophagales bacterium]|nr:hypothetical protein [Chitinophagales bacterium]
MKIRYVFLIATLSTLLIACHSSSPKKITPAFDLSKIKTGMTFMDVANTIGTPDTIIRVGVMLDEFGSQIKTDEWWYGKNIVIVMVNDTVNGIDPDAIATEKRIKHIIDSAKAADGNNSILIQPSQQ